MDRTKDMTVIPPLPQVEPELPNLPANARSWCWRMNGGQLIRPRVMATRHMHHALVMIWHHTMPEDARIRPNYQRYSFGSFCTDAYFREAISVFLTELAARDDLKPWQLAEIRKMILYLRNNETLPAQRKRIAQDPKRVTKE